MKKSYRAWYVLGLLLALVPAGARMLWWQKAGSSRVDPALSRSGEELFHHVWQPNDPLSPDGDGIGPVFNATSCVACHHQGGPGGGGGLEHNVTMFTATESRKGAAPRTGVVHTFGLGYRETLRDVHPDFPSISQPSLDQIVSVPGSQGRGLLRMPAGVFLSQRNTPALFGAGAIDQISERVIVNEEKAQRMKWGMAPADNESVPVGRAVRLAGGRLGRFGWKGQTASLADFVQAACANELGLGNPGHAQPQPLGQPTYQVPGLDLTQLQCDQLTAFVASRSRPVERPAGASAVGKQFFGTIGCADCHKPNLGPVDGIYSDLLLHHMGQELVGGGYYGEPPMPLPDGSPGEGASPSEWRTPPLWGVADSAPYLHDGRAATLEDAIRLHGGQARRAAERFLALAEKEQVQLVAFLRTLRAP
jgi:CxxC motif-containing protein (DUF1111 family)